MSRMDANTPRAMVARSRTRRGVFRGAGAVASALAALALLVAAAPAGAVSGRFSADPAAAQAALSLAREVFDAWVLRHERIVVPDDLPPLLRERSGVFVSAMLGDAPRCCMGTLHPTRATLAEQIVEAAVAAAGMDARFPAITPDELPRLRVIVSIVEPPEPISRPVTLDPAEEGLAVRSRCGWGVVLPRETPRVELIEPWARIRAGAGPGERVYYYRVRAFRIVEPRPEP